MLKNVLKQMIKIDPHFYAAFSACSSACQLLELLPASDLVDDIRDLLHIQHDLFLHMIEGKHYGSDALDEFMKYALLISEEAVRIKEEQ